MMSNVYTHWWIYFTLFRKIFTGDALSSALTSKFRTKENPQRKIILARQSLLCGVVYDWTKLFRKSKLLSVLVRSVPPFHSTALCFTLLSSNYHTISGRVQIQNCVSDLNVSLLGFWATLSVKPVDTTVGTYLLCTIRASSCSAGHVSKVNTNNKHCFQTGKSWNIIFKLLEAVL